MAIENPNFVLRGIRRVAEITFLWALLSLGTGLIIPRLFGPALTLTAIDWATTSWIAKSRIARFAA